MTVFLDTNVLLDYLLGRDNFGVEVAQIITFARRSRVKLVTEAGNFVFSFFFLRKKYPELSTHGIKHNLALLRKEIHCIPFESKDLDSALSLRYPEDLEDGVQLVLAKKANAKYLITNDQRMIKLGKFDNVDIVSTTWFLKNEVS